MAIATVAQYKAYAGITTTDFDTRLAIILPQVQAWGERYCGRIFDQADYIERYSGDDSSSIIIKNAPIVSVTSIKVFCSPADTTGRTVDSGTYTFDTEDNGGIIKFTPSYFARRGSFSFESRSPEFADYRNFQNGFLNVQVTYKGGFDTMPTDLVAAFFDAVTVKLNSAGVDLSMESEKLGEYQYRRGGWAHSSLPGVKPLSPSQVVINSMSAAFYPFRRLKL